MEHKACSDPGEHRLQGVDDAHPAGVRVLLSNGLGDEGEACGKQHEKQKVAPDFAACREGRSLQGKGANEEPDPRESQLDDTHLKSVDLVSFDENLVHDQIDSADHGAEQAQHVTESHSKV